jgi:hypothetical protein
MKFFVYLFDWFGGVPSDCGVENVGRGIDTGDDTGCTINPTTGLPMIDSCGGVDVGGSPFGMDIHQDDLWSSDNGGLNDDAWTSGSSNWDDLFSSSTSCWDD